MRDSKPFSVWPDDRERPYHFETFTAAEAYAIRSLRRSDGVTVPGLVVICYENRPAASVKLHPVTDKPVVDLTDLGARFV